MDEELARELSDEIHEIVKEKCAVGDELAGEGKYVEARVVYGEAFQVLPRPREQWEAATWIWAAIGDSLFLEGKFEDGKEAFIDAQQCAGGMGNPFIHLRLGQCWFELGELPRAGDQLARAYMGAGREIFEREDPKYFNYLETVLKPPAGEERL